MSDIPRVYAEVVRFVLRPFAGFHGNSIDILTATLSARRGLMMIFR